MSTSSQTSDIDVPVVSVKQILGLGFINMFGL